MNSFFKRLIFTVVVVLLLSQAGCPEGCNINKYNPVGEWNVSRRLNDEIETLPIRFTGTRLHGEVYWNNLFVGYYDYNQTTLSFRVKKPDNVDLGYETFLEIFSGEFEDETHLSGTVRVYAEQVRMGSWTAMRTGD